MSNSKPPWFRCLCKHLLNERICWVIELRVFDCTCTSQKWQLIRSLWNYVPVYCQIWLSILCSAVRIAIKHQSSDLQVPSLNAARAFVIFMDSNKFLLFDFFQCPQRTHARITYIFKEYHMFGIVCRTFFKSVKDSSLNFDYHILPSLCR